MKKNFILIITFFVFLFSSQIFSQAKQIFESPNLKVVIKRHQIVAILPFDVSITYKKQPKNFSADANKAQEQSMETSIQSSMYTYLLRKAKNYNVNFQDVDKTNILLRKAGIFDKRSEFTKDEICKVLGVDAVIGGSFVSEQSKSEGAAIATAILFGGFGGKTGSGSLTMTLHDAAAGELLWRFFKTMDDNISSSTDDLVEHMMRKVSRNFPYQN